jgi:hypothetical protein
LNYLRELGVDDEIVLPKDSIILKELKKEFKFYQIPFPVVPLVSQEEWEKIAMWTGVKEGKWKLNYKATRDGFGKSDYESKGILSDFSLSVIQSSNGNVFGEFWKKYKPYGKDHFNFTGFHFSLVNFMDTQIKTYDFSVQNKMDGFGKFGFQSERVSIVSDSNFNLSYSNLNFKFGHGYEFQKEFSDKYYLAGTQKFSINEIEVYTSKI